MMRPRLARPVAALASILTALWLAVGFPTLRAQESPHGPPTATRSKDFRGAAAYKVAHVVDGDTVVLMIDGKPTKFRLIGVDTPETVHPNKPVERYGREASKFLKDLIGAGSVYVEREPGSKQDRYGRELGYLYRAPDGLFINREIVRRGYGHAYTRFPFAYLDDFRAAEREARESAVGLWAPEPAAPPIAEKSPAEPAAKRPEPEPKPDAPKPATVYATRTGTKYHAAGCRYLAKSSVPLPLTDAARKYGPCSVCHPPTLADAGGDQGEGAPVVSRQPARGSSAPSSTATGICGALTKKGTPCQRRVKDGGRCYQHGG